MSAPRFVQPPGAGARDSRTTAALACGIAGIALCIVSLGVASPLTLVLGGVALGLGLHGRRRDARHSNASIAVGAVALALSVLALMLWTLIFVLGGMAIELWGIWEGLEQLGPLDPRGIPGEPA